MRGKIAIRDDWSAHRRFGLSAHPRVHAHCNDITRPNFTAGALARAFQTKRSPYPTTSHNATNRAQWMVAFHEEWGAPARV